MFPRRQLPVSSPIRAAGLVRAAGALVAAPTAERARVSATLASVFDARAVTLTDSGTSALVLALRLAAGRGKTVAYPGYACVDLAAAARFAGLRVRLYDVDPITLSPDLDSLRHVLDEGADAVVVAHLYGFPADVDAVLALTAEHGIPVIEDAAQQAGATLRGRRAGALGDLSVLSFGRGKGVTAGNGGALLALTPAWEERVAAIARGESTLTRGTGDLARAAASWLLGRPALYDIPASIPSLHLGETVYHDAHEPAPMSRAAVALLSDSLATMDAHTYARRDVARRLREYATRATHTRACTPIADGDAGYLRFPVLTGNDRTPSPTLGIVRGYPRSLAEQTEMQPLLRSSRASLTGARELADTLVSLPTHHMVTPRDIAALGTWLTAE